jgi:hypothetical protein
MNEDNSVADDMKRQAAMFYNSTERFVLLLYNRQLFECPDVSDFCKNCASARSCTLFIGGKVQNQRIVGNIISHICRCWRKCLEVGNQL